MRFLVAIALVAGCTQSSYDKFRAELTAAWCARLERCGRLAGDRCSTLPDASALGGDGTSDIPSSIAQHHMTFHPDNAHACLTAVTVASCDDAQLAADIAVACHGIVTGAVDNGKPCVGDGECLGGTCDGASCNRGVCRAFSALGAACLMDCDPTQMFCDAASGTCLLKRARGSSCAGDDECLFSAVCVDGKCGDRPRGGGGAACDAMSPACADGFYCAGGVCSLLRNRGESCSDPGACAADSACIAGVCAAPAAFTYSPSCTSDGDCPPAQYCETSFCDWRRGVGGVCVATNQCAGGLVCAGNTCRYAGACNPPGN